MRLGYVIIDCDGRDGTAVAMTHVMHRMAARGHDVHLLAATARGADPHAVRWHRVRALPGPAALRFASFYANCSRRLHALRRECDLGFDVVHSAGCNTAGADLYQVQNVQPAKRAVLTRFGEFSSAGVLRSVTQRAFYALTTRAERHAYSATNVVAGRDAGPRFAAASAGVAQELQHWYAVPNGDIDVIPNGVDLSRFRPCEDDAARRRLRQEIGLPDGAFVFLFVGGEWRRKGLRHAIDALPHLKTPSAGGALLIVAGRDADRHTFRRQAERLGVGGRVHFVGFDDRPERLMAAADAFVLPTCYEAFSLATLEAAAAGLPVVVGRTNGTVDLIRPNGVADGVIGENGAIVARDGLALAAVLNTLAADAGLRRRLGARGRALVEAEYDWDRVADAFEALYRTIHETRAASA